MSKKLNLVCPECGCDVFYSDKQIRDYYKPTPSLNTGFLWEIVDTDYEDSLEQIKCRDCDYPVELSNEEGVVRAI